MNHEEFSFINQDFAFVEKTEAEDMESLSWVHVPNVAETRQVINLYFRRKVVG